MPAPAHGDIQMALSAEFNGVLNVIRIHTTDDYGWTEINRAVENVARAFVGRVSWQDQLAVQRGA
jgi:hypothetical protein